MNTQKMTLIDIWAILKRTSINRNFSFLKEKSVEDRNKFSGVCVLEPVLALFVHLSFACNGRTLNPTF